MIASQRRGSLRNAGDSRRKLVAWRRSIGIPAPTTLDGNGANTSVCGALHSRDCMPTTGAMRSTTVRTRRRFGADLTHCFNRQTQSSVHSLPVSSQRSLTRKSPPYVCPLLPLACQQSMHVTFRLSTPLVPLSQLMTSQHHYAVCRANSLSWILLQRGSSSNARTSCLQSSLL